MKKLSKLLILLLSVALVCAALAVAVSANTSVVEYTDEFGEKQTTDTIADAILNVAEGGSITLKSDFDITESLRLDKSVTFNLGGRKLTNSVGDVFSVTAEGEVNIVGGGKIVAKGSVIKISDPDLDNDAKPEVNLVGKTDEYPEGLILECGGDTLFDIGDYCSLSVSDILGTANVSNSSVSLGQGVYFGATNAELYFEAEAGTLPEGNFVFDITSSAVIDLFDCTVVTAGNGIKVADGTLFSIVIQGTKFICEGNSNGPQTFFEAIGIGDLGISGTMSFGGSSNLAGSECLISATAKIFETDLTSETGYDFSVGATDTEFAVTGDGETAKYIFGGAVNANIGSGCKLGILGGKELSAAAKAAGCVVLGEGVRILTPYTDAQIENGLKIYIDVINDERYPYLLGYSSPNEVVFDGFDTAGVAFNTPTTSNIGVIKVSQFAGYLTHDGEVGNGKVTYHLPEFVSNGNGGYKLADGVKGNAGPSSAPSKVTYTPPTSAGAKDGKVKISNTSSDDEGYDAPTQIDVHFLSGYYSTGDGEVIRFSFDISVDAIAGSPGFSIILVSENAGGSQVPVVFGSVSGKNITLFGQSREIGENGLHIDIVYKTSSGELGCYVNNEFFKSDTKLPSVKLRGYIRFKQISGTYGETASLTLDNIEGTVFKNSADRTFDYSEYAGNAEFTPNGVQIGRQNAITVNGIGYSSLVDAYADAAKLGAVVRLNEELAQGSYNLPDYPGVIVTNGFANNAKFNSYVSYGVLSDFSGNDVYHYSNETYGAPITVNWYYGMADDAEADTDKWVVAKAGGGSVPFAPEIVSTEPFEYGNSLIYLAGWSLEYISISDYGTIAEYKEAAEAAMLDELEIVSKQEALAGESRTYYPIYGIIYENILFKIIRKSGAVLYFETIEQWNTIATTYITADRNALEYGLRDGDVLKLMSDMTWNEGSAMTLGAMHLTIDLNGYTINATGRSASSHALFAIGAGLNTADGGHTGAVGLTVISSREGGKIIDRAKITDVKCVFRVYGSNKTVHVGGEGSYPVEFECTTLVDSRGALGGNGAGCSIWFDGVDIKHIQPEGGGFYLVYYRNEARDGINKQNIEFKNANIVSTSNAPIIYTCTTTDSGGIRANITFTDSVIEHQTSTGTLANLDSKTQRVVLNNTKVILPTASLGNINTGKVVIGEGTVIRGDIAITEYSEDNLNNLTGVHAGIFYGAEGLTCAKHSVSNSAVYNQIVKTSDVVNAKWLGTDGSAILELVLSKNAKLEDFVPESQNNPTVLNAYMTLVANGWKEADTSTADARIFEPEVTVVRGFVPSKISVTLDTMLLVNIYIPEAVYNLLGEGSTEFEAEPVVIEGDNYYRATVAVATNEIFTGASVTVNLVDRGYSSSKTSTISVVDYAAAVLANAGMSDEDRDLAYYMLTYISAAYDYMTDDDNENAVAQIADILEGYTPTAQAGERTQYTTDASALAGKLEIAVNLASTPEYVIRVLDSAITKIIINGNEYEVENGTVTYADLRIFNFDKKITVALESGERGSYCYSDYCEAVAEIEDEKLNALTEALYDYIVFAKGYKTVDTE